MPHSTESRLYVKEYGCRIKLGLETRGDFFGDSLMLKSCPVATSEAELGGWQVVFSTTKVLKSCADNFLEHFRDGWQ